MNINLEALEQIPILVAQIKELINLQKEGTLEKIWLNVEEAAYYIGYSKDKIYKLIQEDWTEGIHYFKPTGRVIINRNKIDDWIKNDSSTSVNNILEAIRTSI